MVFVKVVVLLAVVFAVLLKLKLLVVLEMRVQDVSNSGNGGKGLLGNPASPRNRPGEVVLSARIMDTAGMVEGVEANGAEIFKKKG